jgi:pimeloyl-ACP methyl ester carboxylesterase
MAQTHLAARTLKGAEKPDKDVQVLFAVRPNRKALLFIHGFSGDAINTWSYFHVLLPESPSCVGRDLYFYGYDGLRAEMIASASLFRDFLERLFNGTDQFVNENLPPAAQRPKGFDYDELIIVAHSLGAVITRRALLDATKKNAAWLSKARMILYAPAHRGASVVDLALETVSSFSFLRFFGSLARLESPLIDQLKPDSRDLNNLIEETEGACKGGANIHLVARKVCIAEYEKIVRNETFGIDPPAYTISNTTHTSVCKPRSDFRAPIIHLEECL